MVAAATVTAENSSISMRVGRCPIVFLWWFNQHRAARLLDVGSQIDLLRMKITALSILGGITLCSFGFAQGGAPLSLPPGLAMKLPPPAPAPTPQPSDSRFAISIIPTNLTVPGSYYLITNLTGVAGTNGITVKSDDVTIDLNGFALVGVTNSGVGIAGGSYGNLAVRNGTIRAWRTGASSSEGGATRWDRIQFANNVVGLAQGDGWAVVSGCTAVFNASYGIVVEGATVTDCVSSYNGGSGFFMRASTARGC